MFVHRAANHGDAGFGGDIVAHLREAGARYQKRDLHLRGLDHHLGCETPGGVKNLVRAIDIVEPHFSGDGIYGIVAAHVFHEHEDFAVGIG